MKSLLSEYVWVNGSQQGDDGVDCVVDSSSMSNCFFFLQPVAHAYRCFRSSQAFYCIVGLTALRVSTSRVV